MDRPAVTALLTQLRDELESGKPVTEQDRELLRKLASDIQSELAGAGGGSTADHAPAIERLKAAVTRFEVSHPDLTAVMERVVNGLQDMGI